MTMATTRKKTDSQAEAETATANTETPAPAAPAKDKRPTWWNFDEDGAQLVGTFVRFGKGQTKQGPGVFVELDVDGERRTLWLLQTVPYWGFKRELEKRPSHDRDVGERVEITRLGWRASEEGGREYMDYRIVFEHAYEPSPAEIFELDQATTTTTEASADDALEETSDDRADDDIPF
jgi:hypothetical protein